MGGHKVKPNLLKSQIPFTMEGFPKIKVAQNSVKLVLILDFLRFDDICEIS